MDSVQVVAPVAVGSVDLTTAYSYPLVVHSSSSSETALRDPADALPPEVMSNVFLWLSHMWPPVSNHQLGWVLVTYVNSRWRNIALSTPDLWARIHHEQPRALQTKMIARAREVLIHWVVPSHIGPRFASHTEAPGPVGLNMLADWPVELPEMEPLEPLLGPDPDFDLQIVPPMGAPQPLEVPDIDIGIDVEETDSDSGDDDDADVFPFGQGFFNQQVQEMQGAMQAFQALFGAFGAPNPTAGLNLPANSKQGGSPSDDMILDLARRSRISGLSCSAGFLAMLLEDPEVYGGLRASMTHLEITQVGRVHDLVVLTRAGGANAALLSSRLRRLAITYSAFPFDTRFGATPPDFWARLPCLTHLKMTFHDAFPGQECIIALQNLPSLVVLELRASHSRAPPSDSSVQADLDSHQAKAQLPHLQKLTIEDRARGQRVTFILLSQLIFPSSARVRLSLKDDARSFLGSVHSHHFVIPHQDIPILDICFDDDMLQIGGWPGPYAYQLGERGAELFIRADSGWASGNTQAFMQSGWFNKILQNMSLRSVSVLRLSFSGARSAAVGWAWLAQCTSLQELSVEIDSDSPSQLGREALRGLLDELDGHGGGHRRLQSLHVRGHMLRDGVDDTLLRWLKRRKAAGIPLSHVEIYDAARAKLQALRRDWVSHLRRYVEHVECDFGWGPMK